MAYFRSSFRNIFAVKDTPHRIALAFALGVFLGVSPLLGLHYFLAFFFAWLFRLNKLVAIAGVSVNNPWTIIPISTFCVWTGAKLIGLQQVMPEVDWKNLSLLTIIKKMTDLDHFLSMVDQLMPLIKAFFLGSFFICTISSVASYFIIQILATRYYKIQDAP